MKLSAILLILFSFMSASLAETANEKKGRLIMEAMEKKNKGFVGEKSDMTMTLIDARGRKVLRKMVGMVKEMDDDGDKSKISFLSPKDVKGTKMLTHSHKVKDDDQWLYLPKSRVLRRISSKKKSSSFMASEFSFEDLGSQETGKYNFMWIKDDTMKVGGKSVKVHVIRRISKNKGGYSKVVLYVSPSLNNPLKAEYYNRRKELFKVATFSKYKTFKLKGKKVYRAGKIHMKNLKTKKESIFEWENRKRGVSFSDRKFSKSSLKK
jgi:outer membrane lipoprotein-sorting protein